MQPVYQRSLLFIGTSNGCFGERQYPLRINCPTITINPATLPSGTVGASYSQQFTQTGGTSPITWSVSAGAIPGGFSLNAQTGELSGMTTAAGIFDFTIRATDANGCFGERQYRLPINQTDLQYYPLPSSIRLLDTKPGGSGCFTPGAPLGSNAVRRQQAAGSCSGVPSTAKAIVGNATVDNSLSSGANTITIFQSNVPQPNAANLHFTNNQIVSNQFTVGLGPDGAFKIHSSAATDFIVDITGYYAPPGQGGLYYHPLPSPVRLLDTQPGQTACDTPGAPLGNNATRTQTATGTCNGITIPSSAKAIVGNATVVNFLSSGFNSITLYPFGTTQPNTPNLHFTANQIVPNAFTVGLSNDGKFNIFSNASTHFIVDVNGYFAGDTPVLEGDIAPRPNGNGAITLEDWNQAGRFAAGLDTPGSGSEFQRADVAPRSSNGNGQLTIADWVQAGRYAAGLDTAVLSSGPTTPFSPATSLASAANPMIGAAGERGLRVVNAGLLRGQNASVSIELEAQGDENAFGFSLTFDPAHLSFVSAAAGSDAPSGAGFHINATQAVNGRVVIALALPAGQTFAAGTRRVVTVTFAVAASGSANSTAVGFGDQPIVREVVDAQANILPATYASGTITLIRPAVSVSAASYVAALASDSIVAVFGTHLATATAAAVSLPLPTSLAGTSVKIKDSAGVEHSAQLFFVSSGQVNYYIPPEAARGTATVTITSGDGAVSAGTIEIVAVAPGLFTFNADGQGVPAAVVRRFRNNQELPSVLAGQLNAQNRWVPLPIDLGPDTDLVILTMFGTGLRFRSSLAAVSLKIDGVEGQLFYAGLAPGFIGLDQIDVGIPRSLIGRGEVNIMVTVDGRVANTVRISIS